MCRSLQAPEGRGKLGGCFTVKSYPPPSQRIQWGTAADNRSRKVGDFLSRLTARHDVRLLNEIFLGEGIGGLGLGGGGLSGGLGGEGSGEGGEGDAVALRQCSGTAGFDARHRRQSEG